jgi:hypothetical protein
MEKENINNPVNVGQVINSEQTMGKEEPIPPQAQKILMGFFRFVMGRMRSLLLIPIIILVSTLVGNRDSIFSTSSLLSLTMIIILIVFYFRSGNKFLDDFEKGMKSVRFDLTDAKVINIGFKKKDQDPNLKK